MSSPEGILTNEQASEFDVFRCHNNDDKPMIRRVAEILRERGIAPWLDKDELRPGQSLQEELEKQIERIKSVAIFVGPEGFGPWHSREIRAFIKSPRKADAPYLSGRVSE